MGSAEPHTGVAQQGAAMRRHDDRHVRGLGARDGRHPAGGRDPWIPWELGIADGEKGAYPVALFPTANKSNEQRWAEQEYLGLYRRIVWGTMTGWSEKGWMVLNHVKNTATSLRKWLEGG